MSIALRTSNTASMQRMCVSPDTPDLRGRADASHAKDLDVVAVCVSHDTPGLRGRADVNRAQDLDGAASMRRVCVTRHTWSKR